MFNYPTSVSGKEIRIPPNVQYTIGVDGIFTKVLPAGNTPNVVYRIGDGTDHPEGWENIEGNKYLDFYISTGATGATGDKGESGKSAYTTAVEYGYTGTQEEWNDMLQAVVDNLDAIIAVNDNETNINAVNANETDISTVATSIASVIDVATNMDNINAVNSNEANINTVVTNITDIQNAEENAASALASSNAASASETSASNNATSSETSNTNSQLRALEAEAFKLTADSYATEDTDVHVRVYTSDGDGTFSSTPTSEYSSKHWKDKAAGAAGDIDSANMTFTNKHMDSYTNFVHADATHFKIISSEELVAGDVVQYVSYDIETNTTRVIKRNALDTVAIGIMKEALDSETIGLAGNTGKLIGVDTSIYDAGDILYPDTSGGLVKVMPEGIAQPIAYVFESDVDDGVLLVNVAAPHELPVQSGNANKFLKTNGTTTVWETPTSTAGQGVSYFLGDTIVSGDNYNLSKYPEGGEEQEIETVTNSTIQPTFIERYVSEAIGGSQLDAGLWTFNTFASVDSNVGTSTIEARINRSILKTGTITSTGTGLTRTFTASEAGTFVSGDADASILNATLIQTPTETFWIDSYVSGIEVTATCDNAGYTNESGVAFSMFYKLFQVSTGEINGEDATLYETQTVQPAFDVDPEDKILVAYFATATTSGDKTLSLYKNGTEHYSNFVTPLVYRHDDLSGLNEGEYRHLGSSQYEKLTDGSQEADTLHKHSASIVSYSGGTTVQAQLDYIGTVAAFEAQLS